MEFAEKAADKAAAWIFRGEREFEDVSGKADDLRRQGAEITETVLPGVGHSDKDIHAVWDDVYAQPDLYHWLLGKHRDG